MAERFSLYLSLARLGKLRAKYERRLSTIAFLFGFVWDNLTLTRIDLRYDNIVLLTHLTIAGAVVLVLGAITSGRLRFLHAWREFVPLLMQFSFGALFSGFFVFYWRGGSFYASWPFIVLLVGLLVGNEFFRERYTRLSFHMSVYFTALFLYLVFALPVAFGKMGDLMFILSGVVALAISGIFITFLSRFRPPLQAGENRAGLIGSIASLYILFNVLYFLNIIPPLPLSLKELGVHHSVIRTAEGYEVQFEPAPRYSMFQKESSIFHRVPRGPVYAYSAVFAPTRISTEILHRWSFYDETRGEWIIRDIISFPISGGRDGGYRGYTVKTNVGPGDWRVDVITERGQLLGRHNFEIVETDAPPSLRTELR